MRMSPNDGTTSFAEDLETWGLPAGVIDELSEPARESLLDYLQDNFGCLHDLDSGLLERLVKVVQFIQS